jgi:ABC-type transporter Mla subunit MlaD
MTQMKMLLEQTSSKTVEEASTATSLMREEAEKAVKTFGATIQNLQGNVAQLLERQASDARIVENLISNSKEVIQKGNLLTQSMTEAIDSINETIRQISGVSRLFIDGANTLKESGQKLQESLSRFALQNEQYLKANKETLDKITSSLKDSERLLKEFAEKFKVIESGLSGIFSRIQEGLEQYALKTRETLNNYLADFASHLAEAAQRLAGNIEALNETVENIEEILSNVKKQ